MYMSQFPRTRDSNPDFGEPYTDTVAVPLQVLESSMCVCVCTVYAYFGLTKVQELSDHSRFACVSNG